MGDRVNIVDFLGQTKSVPEEQVESELARGGRLERTGEAGSRLVGTVKEQEYGGAAGGAAALGLGVARGLTFGGSDLLATELIGVNPAELSGYREENPWLSAGGELAGAIVPGLFTGGAGTVGSLARTLPSGALLARTGKLAGTGFKGLVAAGALEGAAFGAGQGVSSLALSNDPFTVESALSEIGLNALYGTVGGAGGAVLGAGLGKAGSALLARSERVGLASSGVDDALRSAGHDAKIVTAGLDDAASDVRDTVSRMAQGSNLRGSSAQMKRWMQERYEYLNKTTNEIVEQARSVNLGEGRLGKLNKAQRNVTTLAEELLDPNLRVDTAHYLRSQNKLYTLEGELRSVAKKLDSALDLDGAYHGKIIDDIGAMDDRWHGITGSGQKNQRRGPRAADRVNEPDAILQKLVTEEGRAYQEFKNAWGLGEKGVLNEAALKRFTRMNQDEMTEAAVAFSNWRKPLEELAHKTTDAELPVTVKGFLAQFDELIKGTVPGDMAGKSASELMTALGMYGFAETVLPEFDGPADNLVKFWLAHKLTKSPGALTRGFGGGRLMKALGGYAGSRAGGAVAKVTGGGGAASYWLRSEMAHMARSAVAGGNKIAQAAGKATARIENATARILEGAGKASRRVGPTAATILNAASFGGDSEKKKSSSDMQSAYKARARELTTLIANPMRAHQQVFDNLKEVRAAHPLIADRMEMEAVADLQFIYEKMPKDPGTMMRFGQSQWKPDEGKLIAWANTIEAIRDPIAVVEKVANGTISPQAAEALRVRRPALFAEIQKTLAGGIAQLQENVSYDERVRLSVLFAVPVDSSVDPNFVEYSKTFWSERSASEVPVDGNKMKPEEPSEASKLLA